MVLDITKKTGDSLSADEFNKVISAINDKVDKESGKGLSSNDYTTQDKNDLFTLKGDLSEVRTQVKELINNPVSASVAVTDNEKKVGLYNVLGKKHDLYECTFVLEGLPLTQGSTKDFILTDEPLGNKVYISIRSLVITDGNIFYTGGYSIIKLFIDENLNTCLTIKCNETVSGTLKATVVLQYLKIEAIRVDFKIGNIASNVDKSALTLQFPPLKYGKKFAYTFIVDDDKVDSNKLFFTIHKKWVDDEKNYHFGQAHTTGHTPSKALGYTDGCGTEKRFTYGVAVWPGLGNDYIDNFMDPPANKEIGKAYPYLVWREILQIMDFGNEIHFHDVNMNNVNDIPELLKGLEAAQRVTLEKTRTGIKVMVRPNGDDNYIEAAKEYGDIVFMTTEGSNHTIDSLTDNVNLEKGIIWRRNCDSITKESYLSKITEASGVTNKWICDFTHSPSAGVLEGLLAINDTYGKDGNDSIWFATTDEIYEYWFIRKFTRIRKTIENDGVLFTLFVPRLPYSRHIDFTVQFQGLNYSNQTIQALSNIYGLTYGSVEGKFNININANKNLPDLAEKYTSRYESSSLDEDKEDALYFVSQLREDLKTPFIARLNVGEVPPVLNSVSINSGASSTYDSNVVVTLNVIGKITHYKISENQDLTSVSWIEGTSKSLAFNLSSGTYGLKNIYVQVKNTYGESEIKGDSIEYLERPSVTYIVTARANNSAYGSVTPASQIVSPGSSAEVTANANSGYVIESWSGTDNSTGTGQSQGTARVTNIQSDKTVICNFKQEGSTPSTKKKAIISIGWAAADATFDSETGISRLRGITADSSFWDTTGQVMGKLGRAFSKSSVTASLTNNTGKRGSITGNDSGIYPDKYLAVMASPWLVSGDELPTMTLSITNLTPGTYKVKIFASTVYSAVSAATIRYAVNGVVTEKPGSFCLNNLSNYIEFENIVSDGILTIISTADLSNLSPVNIIEIEEV